MAAPRSPRATSSRLLLLLLTLYSSCGLPLPIRRVCPDGAPVKIIQDPGCPRGVCGYTCAPGRWQPPPA